jgi:hypothetical protein
MRGFFAIEFAPVYVLGMQLFPVVSALLAIDFALFREPIGWITAILAVAGLVTMRRFGGSISTTALYVVLGGAWVLTTLAVASIIVQVGRHDVWDFDEGQALVLAVLLLALAGILVTWAVITPSLAALRLLSHRWPGTQTMLREVVAEFSDASGARLRLPSTVKPNVASRSLKGLAILLGVVGSIVSSPSRRAMDYTLATGIILNQMRRSRPH